MLESLLNIEIKVIEKIEKQYREYDELFINVFRWFWEGALKVSNNGIECKIKARYIAIYLKGTQTIVCYIEPTKQQIKIAFWELYYSHIAESCSNLVISTFSKWGGANREINCFILTDYEEEAFVAFDILFQFKKYGKLIEIKKANNSEPDFISIEEIINVDLEIFEGEKRQIVVNVYERDAKGRKICLNRFGHTCSVCAFNFEKEYGEIGKNFIHVHHIKPISLRKQKYKLNPIEDLRPVCPNCHAMLHAKNPPYLIDELKEITKDSKKNNIII